MAQIEQSYVMQRRVPKNAHWARQAELQKILETCIECVEQNWARRTTYCTPPVICD